MAEENRLLVFEGAHKSEIDLRNIEGGDYVRVADLQTIFDLTATPIGNQNLSLVAEEHSIILSVDRTLVSVDGKLVSLSRPVQLAQGVWYVPLDFIPKVLKSTAKKRFLWLPNSRSLILGDLQPNQLALKFSVEKDHSRLVLQSLRPVGFTIIHEKNMLVITPQSEDFVPEFEDTDFTDGIVETLSILSAGEKKVFRILTTKNFASFKSFEMSDPPRLVIDFYRKGSASASAPPPVTPPVQQAVPPTLLPSVVPEKRVIVIDPGHGGTETGAKGPEGTYEKDIVMGIARKLKAVLEGNTEVRVILTRDEDKLVALDDRTALANNNKADLFISIHANATIRGQAKGAETYFLSATATDDEARNIAAIENNAIGLNQVPGVDDDLKLILWDMAQTEYLEESSQLAETIQQELNAALSISNRGIKQAPFRVLMGAMMPAVLIEVGFINNPAEEKMMKDADYQMKIATTIYRSIQKFRSARLNQAGQLKSSSR